MKTEHLNRDAEGNSNAKSQSASRLGNAKWVVLTTDLAGDGHAQGADARNAVNAMDAD